MNHTFIRFDFDQTFLHIHTRMLKSANYHPTLPLTAPLQPTEPSCVQVLMKLRLDQFSVSAFEGKEHSTELTHRSDDGISVVNGNRPDVRECLDLRCALSHLFQLPSRVSKILNRASYLFILSICHFQIQLLSSLDESSGLALYSVWFRELE